MASPKLDREIERGPGEVCGTRIASSRASHASPVRDCRVTPWQAPQRFQRTPSAVPVNNASMGRGGLQLLSPGGAGWCGLSPAPQLDFAGQLGCMRQKKSPQGWKELPDRLVSAPQPIRSAVGVCNVPVSPAKHWTSLVLSPAMEHAVSSPLSQCRICAPPE